MYAADGGGPEEGPREQDARDPGFIRDVAQPLFDRLRAYFRSEM